MVDAVHDAVAATVTVGSGPDSVAFSPDGKWAYVANRGANLYVPDNTVSVIDTSNQSVKTTITVGTAPRLALVKP